MSNLQQLQKKYLPGVAPEDFFLLLSHATGKEKLFLLAHPEHKLSGEKAKKAEQYLERRLKREPVAYITGHKEFYGRDFRVTSDTLIPRPETELMIEQVLTLFHANPPLSQADIIDLGTGSGNIIITLAKEIEETYQIPGIQYQALDISPSALIIATKNAKDHDVKERVTFLQSDLLQNLSLPREKNRHAVIVSNLPYLSSKIYLASSLDIRGYEPKTALVSGHDGLDHYRRLLKEVRMLSRHYISTTFFFEISPEQSTSLKEIILQIFPQSSSLILQDLSNRNRLIQATI